MSVANGREFLAIPGPTNIPDAVLAAMHRPAIDIYSGDMLGITRTLLEDLPKIFRTTGRTYIYAANGHGGWEAAVSNVLSRGETDPRAGERPVRGRLGRDGADDGRQDRGA